MGLKELDKWFNSLTPLHKLVVATYIGDDTTSIPQLIKMGIDGMLKDNFCGFTSYEEAINSWEYETQEDKQWVYDEYKKATEN